MEEMVDATAVKMFEINDLEVLKLWACDSAFGFLQKFIE